MTQEERDEIEKVLGEMQTKLMEVVALSMGIKSDILDIKRLVDGQ